MNRTLFCLAWIAAALVMGGCSSTRFLSSEKAADIGSVDLTGQKVMALLIDPREEVRIKAENALAAELSKRGLEGFAAHTLIPAGDLNDKDKVKAAIHASGAQALVATRLVGTEEQTEYVPGVYDRYSDSITDYYHYGWGTVYAPGYYDSYTIFTVETLCFRVADEKLLWKGVSETVDPTDVKSLVRSLVKEAGQIMTQQGLVRKK